MTIHEEHPFATPSDARDPLRQIRGLMPSPVTIWTTGRGRDREGWTVSSVLIADGASRRSDPDRAAEVIGLIDEDSDLADALAPGVPVTVNVLPASVEAGALADVFARLTPAPGGVFTQGSWIDTPQGPRLENAAAWVTAEITSCTEHAGWALLVRAVVLDAERIAGDALGHQRGRYQR